MVELADWEKPGPPKTGIDAEREEWIRRINVHLRSGNSLEIVLEAFDMVHEWLLLHPGDIGMRYFAGSVARRWPLRGGDDEALPRILSERRARQARQDAA